MTREILMAAALLSLSVTHSQAAVLLSDTGFSANAKLIDFDAPNLGYGTPVKSQISGAVFSGTADDFHYSGNPGVYSNSPNFSNGYLDSFSNRQVGNGGSIYSIQFSSQVTRAGAFWEFNPTSPAATFTALLNGAQVESYVYNNVNCCESAEFIGFSGIKFDQIQISSITGGDFIVDNVRFDSAAVTSGVPEPSIWAMMLLGFAGLAYATSRKQTSGSASFTAA